MGAAAVAPVFGANMNRRGKKGEAMNTKKNENAFLRIISKVWGRSPIKKATALAVMLVITVSCVTTVMADSRRATVYYNDELYSGTLLTSLATVQDAQKQLLSMGLNVGEGDIVSFSTNQETGAVSTDYESPEAADTLCDRTTPYAENWKPTADKLWAERCQSCSGCAQEK